MHPAMVQGSSSCREWLVPGVRLLQWAELRKHWQNFLLDGVFGNASSGMVDGAG
jgi:hypothetical protein